MHLAPSYTLRVAQAVILLIVGTRKLRDNHRLVVFMFDTHLTVLETNTLHFLENAKRYIQINTSLVVSAINDHLTVSPEPIRRRYLTLRPTGVDERGQAVRIT
jgi:hypothetical protein